MGRKASNSAFFNSDEYLMVTDQLPDEVPVQGFAKPCIGHCDRDTMLKEGDLRCYTVLDNGAVAKYCNLKALNEDSPFSNLLK